ncbi:phosphohistidine phosphatase [Pararobbsia alpina]
MEFPEPGQSHNRHNSSPIIRRARLAILIYARKRHLPSFLPRCHAIPHERPISMNLILWRHADAENLPERMLEHHPSDLQRALTERGLKQAGQIGRWLNERIDSDSLILASPAIRAQQTAEALGREFETVREIAPGADTSAVLAAAGWPDGRAATVVVVGHQPTLGRVASLLLAGHEASWSIKKAGVWWFSNRRRDDEAQVVLRAVINPDLV